MLTTSAFYTSTLTTTSTATTSAPATSATTAVVTHIPKETTIITDWISQDIVVGMIVTCVVFLLLVTLAMGGCLFVRKNSTAKKGLPAVELSQPHPDRMRKGVQ